MFAGKAQNGSINRRSFIRTAAGMAAACSFPGCRQNETYPDSRAIVATPEARFEYFKALLDEICAAGPHPIGSQQYDLVAAIVKREMEKALPEVFFDSFEFERWSLTAPAEFRIGETGLETFPSHGSSGTGPEGVQGLLRRVNGMKDLLYAIYHSAGQEEPLAYVSISPFGRAVPLPYYKFGLDVKCLPIFDIGKQDVPLLEEAVKNETPVYASSEVEFTPEVPAYNVVGRLPGQSREEIVYLAHLDTVYNSPGANDNTATVIAMLMIAHAFSGARNSRTLTFVATTGEEYGKLGASNFVQRYRAEKRLEAIRFLINLDSVTWGPDIKINTGDEDILKMLLGIDSRLQIPGAPQWESRDGFLLDAMPFKDQMIRAVYINSGGYDLTHLWHRPEDLPDTVPADCVENWFRLFKEYTKKTMVL